MTLAYDLEGVSMMIHKLFERIFSSDNSQHGNIQIFENWHHLSLNNIREKFKHNLP